MRIFLLRAIVSWWMIPMFVVALPIMYLLQGKKKLFGDFCEVCGMVWKGFP